MKQMRLILYVIVKVYTQKGRIERIVEIKIKHNITLSNCSKYSYISKLCAIFIYI